LGEDEGTEGLLGMQELKVIGVEDGALLAASDDGARYRIEIDEVLQSRIRHAVPEHHNGPKLSPREVQTHIRSGLSAEEVADLTGASVDYIRRFEGPVVAEREHIVTSALAVPVHPNGDPDPDQPASFGSMIRERLSELGAQGERWASWKDPERGWMVKLEFTADGQSTVTGLDGGPTEGNPPSQEDFLVDCVADVGTVPVGKGLDSAQPLAHLQRARLGVELDSRQRAILADLSRYLPLPDVDDQVVADLLRHALSVRAHLQRSVGRADPLRTGSKRHARASASRSIS
jgi:hypothetical protein